MYCIGKSESAGATGTCSTLWLKKVFLANVLKFLISLLAKRKPMYKDKSQKLVYILMLCFPSTLSISSLSTTLVFGFPQKSFIHNANVKTNTKAADLSAFPLTQDTDMPMKLRLTIDSSWF